MTTETLPRTQLATLPTPLVQARRLSDTLGVEIWFKRDDLTGLGLGGNKVRALEYLIGAAEAEGADCLVTGGGSQSNWVMLAALAAASRGLDSHIVYFGSEGESEGNLALVRRIPGVRITFTEDPARSSVDAELDAIAHQLRSSGRRPYLVGRGGAGPVGALGYLSAVSELDDQLAASGLTDPTLWLAAGSCGTLAGLVAGQAISGRPKRIIGVTVHRPVDECEQRVASISSSTVDLIGAAAVQPVDWEIRGSQLNRVSNALVCSAAELAIRTEGVFLDPEFGAPALAELIAVEHPGDVVVFIVTGGAPTLFLREAFHD